MRTKSIGGLLIIVSSFFYASYGIWTTLMGDSFGGFTASALRSLLVLILLFPLAVYTKQIEKLDIRNNGQKITAMILISTLIWGPLYFAVLEAGIGLSLTAFYGALTFGMIIFGALLAKEKLTFIKILSMLVGICGLVLVYIPSSSGSLIVLPLIAALVSGLAAAANNVFAKQLPYNTTQTTLVLWSTSVVANIPMVFIIGESPPLLELSPAWGYLVLFSVASILASWFLLKGMKYIDAGIAGILGLTEIAFALAFGIVLFGETIDSVSFVGALVIVFASSLPFVYKRYGAKKGQKVLSTEE